MPSITPVVKNLILINVLLFIGTILINGTYFGDYEFNRTILAFQNHNFKPFQIITHMFMHSDGSPGPFSIFHLLFNMLTLFFIGPNVERVWGEKKFLFYYLVCGLGSLAGYLAVNHFLYGGAPSNLLGASGAVFGIMIAFAMTFPNRKLSLLFIPVPIKAKYFVAGFVVLDLISGLRGRSILGASNIAHFGHLGGALTGFLLILYWNKFKLR